MYWFGVGRLVAPWAPSLAGPKVTPSAFSCFLISFQFFFSVFRIVSNLLQNCFKQIPKFLKSSKQPSKPIRSMFSETKQDF
jgi:hypothetical protein